MGAEMLNASRIVLCCPSCVVAHTTCSSLKMLHCTMHHIIRLLPLGGRCIAQAGHLPAAGVQDLPKGMHTVVNQTRRSATVFPFITEALACLLQALLITSQLSSGSPNWVAVHTTSPSPPCTGGWLAWEGNCGGRSEG